MSMSKENKGIQFCEEEWSAPKEIEDLERKYLEYYALDNEPVCQSKDIGMVS
ncbi:hypothetical protein [Clostridium nigeriense]|uniref:hypothetical protein n=1 Tax=Clostridium nigeriense TaxID=1805470 RepID=UPI000B18D75F|nr:hypothetical protein [Clostridium nigeriense]